MRSVWEQGLNIYWSLSYFHLSPFWGGCERDRQGRKELVFPSNPTTSCLLTLKECCIQRNKLALLKSARIFLKSETLKALKPWKVGGLPLSSQLPCKHYSPGHFESNIRKSRLLKRHGHQNIHHYQPLSTPPGDQGSRSFGCTASKPISFSDKLDHGCIGFRQSLAQILSSRPEQLRACWKEHK